MENRTVLVTVTALGKGRVLVQPPKGSPLLFEPGDAGMLDALERLARDETQPAHVTEPGGGLDVGDMLRGVGRLLQDAGREKDG